MERSGPPREPGRGVREHYILWHPAREDPPQRLLSTLERRGTVRCCTDEFGAMAGLLLAAREAARAPIDESHSVALVLMRPPALQGLSDVVSGAQRYVPGARMWIYDPEDSKKLRAAQKKDVEAWVRPERGTGIFSDAPGATHAPRQRAAAPAREPVPPQLRLTGEGPERDATEQSESPRVAPVNQPPESGRLEHNGNGPRTRESLLTDEEWAMLLADEKSQTKPPRGFGKGKDR